MHITRLIEYETGFVVDLVKKKGVAHFVSDHPELSYVLKHSARNHVIVNRSWSTLPVEEWLKLFKTIIYKKQLRISYWQLNVFSI